MNFQSGGKSFSKTETFLQKHDLWLFDDMERV